VEEVLSGDFVRLEEKVTDGISGEIKVALK